MIHDNGKKSQHLCQSETIPCGCAHTVAWIQLHRAVREITESWMGGGRAHKMAERESYEIKAIFFRFRLFLLANCSNSKCNCDVCKEIVTGERSQCLLINQPCSSGSF